VRYAISVKGGISFTGTRDEVKNVLMGAMLASSDLHPRKLLVEAEAALELVDADDRNEVKSFGLGNVEIWRERGEEAPGRRYLAQIGRKGIVFQTSDKTAFASYLTGILVGDEVHLEKAAVLAERVVDTLSEGGGYGNELTEIAGNRPVRVWWED
jgi:hypothetical protein